MNVCNCNKGNLVLFSIKLIIMILFIASQSIPGRVTQQPLVYRQDRL